ncbi:MAG: LamG-like jellyroll fold domain-containing protein [Flavobacteriaceae bacterium]|nr:T9SS type A sorting domain-containing protein [Flavobacteriaceae bacterium]
MKTKLHQRLILCLLIVTTVNFFSYSQGFIVNDDFETDALGTIPNGWILKYNGTGDANQKVVDSPVYNGIKAFQMEGRSGWASEFYKIPTSIPNLVTIEAWVNPEKILSGLAGSIGLGDFTVGTWGTRTSRLQFFNGKISTLYQGGSTYIIQDYVSGNWYHFKMEHDLTAKTYKVYINGALVSGDNGSEIISEFPMHPSVNSIHLMLAAGNSGTTKMTWDDIKLYETKDLVAYYPFNGNANDESGNSLDGTVNGATLTTDRFGNPNSAYSFDGNDIITVAHNNILNSSDELSFSVWVKPTTLQNAMILGKSNYTTATNYLLRTKSTGYIQFEYKDFANSNSLPLIVNDWNHIAVVSNTDNSKQVYINGALASHTTASSPYGLVTNMLTIGARTGNEFFNGSIDDLRIYKSALSETNVLNLFNNNALSLLNDHIKASYKFYIYNNSLHFSENQNLAEVKSVFVYNLLGQEVLKSSEILKEIPLSFLNIGIYIIKVEGVNGNTTTRKFVIQ